MRRGGSFERVVGNLRSVNGAKNVTRPIMVQRKIPQPMVVLSAGVGELTLLTKAQMTIGIETDCDAKRGNAASTQ